MTRKDTQMAIEQISDTLHLPFTLADVSGIDVANNLKMDYGPATYYSSLGQSEFYTRHEQQPNGLYYKTETQLRRLLFYDKVHEHTIKGYKIPEEYKNTHQLRFELRFKNRLKTQLKVDRVSGASLSNEQFFIDVIDRWEREYFLIDKIKSKTINLNLTGSTKYFIEQLAFLSVLEVGQHNIINTINAGQEKGYINIKQAYRLRESIKRISSVKEVRVEKELITELDLKIRGAANEARSLC